MSLLTWKGSVWKFTYVLALDHEIPHVSEMSSKLGHASTNSPFENDRARKLLLPASFHADNLNWGVISAFPLNSSPKLSNRVNSKSGYMFPPPTVNHTRGHKYKKQRCRLQARQKFFSQRVVEKWNNLPESVVLAPSLKLFKARLDEHWRDEPFHYECRGNWGKWHKQLPNEGPATRNELRRKGGICSSTTMTSQQNNVTTA